ncbi:hypothetical protein [Endozoicomonas sp. SCSIO W0465]|uniref:ISAzo13-like element transposase-related protein n=1 Tax=Endozoicomonas sp. SCSIO W0465 TaxID=2918516 RepID=UPI002075810C|nr:hypothetical protein [Endozoicomonas sp. SCSIO W0465]USE37813.1 hypothetical protein MJO57_06370 [Endozoicomonas sp. SCSIO W0465]
MFSIKLSLSITICGWPTAYIANQKPRKKKTMGENKDRDVQFKQINRLKKEYLEAGKPVLSVDSKKKETLGNFYREGVADAVEPTVVNDHDFASQGNGKVIPHGVTMMACSVWLLRIRIRALFCKLSIQSSNGRLFKSLSGAQDF